MESIFQNIMIASIYGSIVGGVLLLFKKLIGNRLSANWHYAIWSILLVKLLIPVGPSSNISFFNLFSGSVDSFSKQEIEAQNLEQVLQNNEFTITGVVELVPTQSETNAINKEEILSDKGDNVEKVALPQVVENQLREKGSALQEEQQRKVEGKLSFWMISWVIGGICIGLLTLFTQLILWKNLKKTNKAVSEETLLLLDRCKKELGIRKSIPILIQDAIEEPSLMGLWRPKILLSSQVLGLEQEAIEHILLHELTHYKRKDLWINFLLVVLQIVHWFNPVVHYCFKKVRQDMELATDYAVVSNIAVDKRLAYGNTLLDVMALKTKRAYYAPLVGMVDHKSSLKARIKQIKDVAWGTKRNRGWIVGGIGVFILLGGILLTSRITGEVENTSYWEQRAKVLVKYKTPYVGNNSKVIGAIDQLDFVEYRKDVYLQTEKEPYGITVNYNFIEGPSITVKELERSLYSNAATLFYLIDNLGEVTFQVENLLEGVPAYEYHYTREKIAENTAIAKDKGTVEELHSFLKELNEKIFASPTVYTTEMLSSPGIALENRVNVNAVRMSYEATDGSFRTVKSIEDETILYHGRAIEVPMGLPTYWSPVRKDGTITTAEETRVTLKLYDGEGMIVDTKEITIYYKDGFYVTTDPTEIQNTGVQSQTLEKNTAVIRRTSGTRKDELIFTTGRATLEGRFLEALVKGKKLLEEPVDLSEDYFTLSFTTEGKVEAQYQIWDNKMGAGYIYITVGNNKDTIYQLEKDIAWRNFIHPKITENNIIWMDSFEGLVTEISKKDKGRMEVTLEGVGRHRSTSRITISEEDVDAYSIKEGQYIELYLEGLRFGKKVTRVKKIEMDYGTEIGTVQKVSVEGQTQQLDMLITEGENAGKVITLYLDKSTYYPNKVGRNFAVGDRIKIEGNRRDDPVRVDKLEVVF